MNKTLKQYASYPTYGEEKFICKTPDYEEKETGETKATILYAWLPVYIGQPNMIPLKGCRFAWFKNVKVIKKRILYRSTEFDGGWRYKNYWLDWKERWVVIDVIQLLK